MAGRRHIRRFWRMLAGTGAVLALCAAVLAGWQWMAGLRCERIEVVGARYAEPEALLELAGIDTTWMLLDINPELVADRVRRHPWIQTARATRLPTGTLRIDVAERVPVLLVLDREGRPSHYLDRFGFAMPLVHEAAFDVPLLRGLREAYHPVRRVEHATVRDLLEALTMLDPGTDALVAEFEIEPSGELVLHTTPAGERGSIPVRLGREAFGARLRRLHAFWHQAVLTQPEKTFALIDLRFDSQIVTRESVRSR